MCNTSAGTAELLLHEVWYEAATSWKTIGSLSKSGGEYGGGVRKKSWNYPFCCITFNNRCVSIFLPIHLLLLVLSKLVYFYNKVMSRWVPIGQTT